jgi:hypothetical protein
MDKCRLAAHGTTERQRVLQIISNAASGITTPAQTYEVSQAHSKNLEVSDCLLGIVRLPYHMRHILS